MVTLQPLTVALRERSVPTVAEDTSADLGMDNGSTDRSAALVSRVGHFRELQRGADTLFVQACLARYGHQAVTFVEDMVVRHLEIADYGAWLRQQVIRGRNNQPISAASAFRELGLLERLAIYRRCRSALGYGRRRSLLSLGALALGNLGYWCGEATNADGSRWIRARRRVFSSSASRSRGFDDPQSGG